MSRRPLVDAGFLAALGVVGLLGFGPVFSGLSYLVAGVAGLLLGLLVALAAVRLRWGVLVTVAAGLVVYLLAAGPAALRETTTGGVVPGPATVRGVVDGSVHGWRDLLTTLPPAPASGHLLVIPYLCGFVCGLAGMLLAGRTRLPTLPLLAPGALLVASILFGTDAPASLLVQGVGFAALALAWAALRQRRRRPAAATVAGVAGGRRRVAGAAAMVVLAAGGGFAAALPADDDDRYVLREHVQPPLDLSEYPSPLAGLRRFEVADKDKVLFSVSGLPAGARVRLAVMDAYDGVVWSVAGGAGATTASGVFERVGTTIPSEATGAPATVQVTIRNLGGVWVPTVGALTGARFGGPRAAELAGSFRYNRSTGTGLAPAVLAAGDAYTLDVLVPAVPGEKDLAGRATMAVTLPDIAGDPEPVQTLAVEWATAATPMGRLNALLTRMHAGAYSDGTGAAGVPSRPGHGAGRLREFLAADQLVGDSEQYAATLALMLRRLGIPARVVLGVAPSQAWFARTGTGAGDVTGGMVSAWVEVAVDGLGWVPFDPTPPITNKPKPPKPEPNEDGDAKIVQPPTVALPAPDQAAPPDADDSGDDLPPPDRCAVCAVLLTIATYVGLPVLLFALVVGAIVGLKQRRRRRRRRAPTSSAQIANGWLELLDRLRDLGVPSPTGQTRRRAAQELAGAQALSVDGRAAATRLALVADAAVFGPGDPSPEAVTAYWSDVDESLRGLRRERRPHQRFLAMVNLATLWPGNRRRAA
ncbi:transglutaminase-like domain-containing protein [Luedemannella helvata]|uniref:Transglutaminase-like domain-containing protein n=1 Tax=Luedemannella helvata TaxID=349315 RepID=A0ABN2L7P7_9ACTN